MYWDGKEALSGDETDMSVIGVIDEYGESIPSIDDRKGASSAILRSAATSLARYR
jgi:hypothetical protein